MGFIEHGGIIECDESASGEEKLLSRRAYPTSLKKWSKTVFGSVLLGGILSQTDQQKAEAG